MRTRDMVCNFCGFHYDPDQHLACQSCPLHANCNLVCCPACGYQTVNPRRSSLVRLVRRFPRHKKFPRKSQQGLTLADVPPGCTAEFMGFADSFPADRKASLQAYGLVVNHKVQVVQHAPVTIIRLDNIELALERDLARGIKVSLSPPGKPNLQ